eukprot:CAMPEP_0175814254 /NCGR_PEP_ID=MMETSP0107_2-20121207/5319_1 /TAXON_ID=195067 ORGANISM="Goniomonas pacifica, Strain CCMP1869" /NCGR_SAMPLE_ID=MMETSP0107_2 /ASSEMBLY_ACC=CAM_ASM_000203 /LENGTH=118 /DNA_ID=CAMNT_0017126185 /DNA_START=106 /DNA_END=463 /DNA_ORIENTATION=+
MLRVGKRVLKPLSQVHVLAPERCGGSGGAVSFKEGSVLGGPQVVNLISELGPKVLGAQDVHLGEEAPADYPQSSPSTAISIDDGIGSKAGGESPRRGRAASVDAEHKGPTEISVGLQE